MAYENLCMYCFEDNGGQDVCPHCGRDARAAVPQVQLLPGTLLYNERFLVGRALGQDASGIVYAALDTKRSVKIRIREYLPRDSARRLNSGEVVPESGAEDAFEGGLSKLRASVEGVEDPSKRHFFFEENGTGYIAQRKSTGGGGAETDEERQGPRLALVIGIAAALVLAVAVGVIMLVNYLTNRTDTKAEAPRTSAEDIWSPPESPTPTPYAAATFGTITDPEHSWMDFTNPDLRGDESDFKTAKPTAVPTADDGFDISKTINAKSSPSQIKKLQTLLTNLGWLPAGNINGTYDSATKQAVKDAQQYINDTYAFTPKLTVDGIAGPKTLGWLVRTDLSAKPSPTPAPITPNPTQAGRTIDENSTKEEIKYVQGQLAILGLLDTSNINGVYDKTTRAAVLKFQQRVNDLQGYDALGETGTVDERTLAYLDYYVDWWQNNRPTATPAQGTATPAPTATVPAEGGDVIDENAPTESIKAVQEMLIALGYLDGTADGSYGQKTYAAVKSFQNFINAQHGNKVAVTGKTDEITRNYLEFYYDNMMSATPSPTAPSDVEAPVITVTGAAAHENGVYYVGKGGVKVTWSAVGTIDGYAVYLQDDDGTVVRKLDSTKSTSLDFPQSYLTNDGIYTFIVAAIPTNEGEGERPYASVSLQIAAAPTQAPTTAPTQAPTPTAGNLKPEITVTGADAYQDGVYQIGSAGAGISWSASGAGAYSLYITDENKEILNSVQDTQLTSYQIEASGMEAGRQYTFTVVAIPEGGVEKDGAYASVKLMRAGGTAETPTPEPSATPATDVEAPVFTVTGALGEQDGAYWVGDEKVVVAWSAAGHVGAYNVYLKNAQGGVISEQKGTSETSTTIDPEAMTTGQRYIIEVLAIPAGGTEADGKASSIAVQLYAGETAAPTPAPNVEAPEIAVSGHKDFVDGVYYAGADGLAFSWDAKGDVASYDVKMTGSDGTTLYEKTGETKKNGSLTADKMAQGVIYTLTITAVPENGTAADGKSASIMIALFQKQEVGTPTVTVTGAAKEQDGGYYVGGDDVTISWNAENAETYNVTVEKSDGSVRELLTGTKDKSTTVKAADVREGVTYRVTVTAIAKGGSAADGKSASVLLAKLEKEVPEVGAPSISVSGQVDEQAGVYYVGDESLSVSWSADNAAAYSVYLYDGSGEAINSEKKTDKTSVTLKPGLFAAGQTYKLTVVAIPADGKEAGGKSASISIARAEEEAPEVGVPTISVSGHVDYTNETYWKGEGNLTLSWGADNAEKYFVYLTDSSGNIIIPLEDTTDTSASLTSKKLVTGEIYTLTVYALPAGGKKEDAKSASVMIALQTAAATQPPAAGYIDKNSDPEVITGLQTKLYKLGWLSEDAKSESGTFGPMTRRAVYEFQSYVAAEGINPEIGIIDPADENASVDAGTLTTLYDAENPVQRP